MLVRATPPPRLYWGLFLPIGNFSITGAFLVQGGGGDSDHEIPNHISQFCVPRFCEDDHLSLRSDCLEHVLEDSLLSIFIPGHLNCPKSRGMEETGFVPRVLSLE